ncbi:T-cell leukemia translocation-altered gene protein homolog [Gambusia affinis]|uniref:T-cell leukemia translocation-altered gene protein homolog n=1 Tax=Gambusia affinis TaxID=33528 RepID=UPI001CDBF817|nr:T-cell leukemia translocation-altered gene protein homolog [Gambusia affinis]
MEESWDFEFLSRIADSCLSFISEFVDDWLANDMRVSIFKILLSWLIFSLIVIHFAWKVYGNTVNDMYYRQGGCTSKNRRRRSRLEVLKMNRLEHQRP